PIQNVLARIQVVQAFKLEKAHQQALKDVPVHLIANQDDFLVPYQRSQQLQQLFPHSQLSLFATGAYASMVTETSQINQSILQFLKSSLYSQQVTLFAKARTYFWLFIFSNESFLWFLLKI